MKILRKTLCLTLVLILCISSLACGSKTAAGNLDIEQAVTINVWYQDDKYTSYLEYVAESFNKENPLVTINCQLITEDNYVEYIYEQSVHGDAGPDVFLMNTDNLEKASMTGLLSENNSYSKYYTTKYYSDTALKSATYNGKLYGYPLSFNVAFLLYNSDVASEVSNFSELADFCNNYQIDENNQSMTHLVLWNSSDMFINYGFSCNSLNIGGTDGDDSSQIRVDKNLLTKGMQNFLNQKDVFGISRDQYTIDEIMQLFAEGKVAYTITDANHLKTVTDSSVNYGICDVPDFDDDLNTVSISENVSAFVNPYAGHITAAKAVAHAISFDYSDSLYDMAGAVSAKTIKITKSEKNRMGKLYEIYAASDVKAKFMGSAYYYTKYDILIHKIWDGDDLNSSIENFINETVGK